MNGLACVASFIAYILRINMSVAGEALGATAIGTGVELVGPAAGVVGAFGTLVMTGGVGFTSRATARRGCGSTRTTSGSRAGRLVTPGTGGFGGETGWGGLVRGSWPAAVSAGR